MPNWKYIRYDIEQWWGQLTARRWAEEHPGIIFGITCASVFLLLTVIVAMLIPDSPKIEIQQSNKAWFYDLNTGDLFADKNDSFAPIEAPSGPLPNGEPAGVRAYVYSYSGEPNDPNHFIVYLEKFTAEGKEYASSFKKSPDCINKDSVRQMNNNRLVKRVTDKEWFPATSREGVLVTQEVFIQNKQGQLPKYFEVSQ